MQTKKMSLANITGKLSRAEMKNIMAGSGCTLGSQFFYSGPDGCGTATVVGGGNGSCEYSINITQPPPCGWA
jgi:hypothetical protein